MDKPHLGRQNVDENRKVLGMFALYPRTCPFSSLLCTCHFLSRQARPLFLIFISVQTSPCAVVLMTILQITSIHQYFTLAVFACIFPDLPTPGFAFLARRPRRLVRLPTRTTAIDRLKPSSAIRVPFKTLRDTSIHEQPILSLPSAFPCNCSDESATTSHNVFAIVTPLSKSDRIRRLAYKSEVTVISTAQRATAIQEHPTVLLLSCNPSDFSTTSISLPSTQQFQQPRHFVSPRSRLKR
jgi:hypothetical protein